jgi:transcription elongation GreA/GreB family factor
MKRKAELERDLLRAKGTDFANVNTDVVTIGTRIDMTNLDTQATESYAILGAWDSDPDENVMSYLTPMAQAVINHKSGDEVEFEMGSQKQRYRIDSIDYALDQASDSEENQEEATSA